MKHPKLFRFLSLLFVLNVKSLDTKISKSFETGSQTNTTM